MKLKNLFRTRYTKDEKLFIDFSLTSSFLKTLSNNELMVIYPHIHIRKYKQEEIIFFSDDSSMALYIIMDGEVSLNIEHKNRLEQFLVLSSGESLGDVSLLYDHPRPYTTIVKSHEATLGVIPSLAIIDIMNNNKDIKIKIIEYMAKKYSVFTHQLFRLYKESAFFEMNRMQEVIDNNKS